MRHLNLVQFNNELYEVIKQFPFTKFKADISGENADILKQHYNVDKIIKSIQTQEYLFVNKIEEAQIIE